jgi:hypothetical protein
MKLFLGAYKISNTFVATISPITLQACNFRLHNLCAQLMNLNFSKNNVYW